MSHKIYIKPPQPTQTVVVAEIVVATLFLPLGIVFAFIADDEVQPFVLVFALIWVTMCIALIVHGVKTLGLIKTGKIEIAEIEGALGDTSGDFASRMRALEALKKDGLISEDEYRKKRNEILQEKW